MFFKHRASHMVDFNSWVREREPLTLHHSVTKLSRFRVCSRSCSPSKQYTLFGEWISSQTSTQTWCMDLLRKHLGIFGAGWKWRYFGVLYPFHAFIAQPDHLPYMFVYCLGVWYLWFTHTKLQFLLVEWSSTFQIVISVFLFSFQSDKWENGWRGSFDIYGPY